jgi:hypothetical protein
MPYSYYELARLFPRDLMLTDDAAPRPRSVDFLETAVSQVARLDIDYAMYLPHRGKFIGIPNPVAIRLETILAANREAFSLATMAVEQRDFCLAAKPRYGTSRVTEQMNAIISAVSHLIDLLCLKGCLAIEKEDVDVAADCGLTLLRLSNMLCLGGGDFEFYRTGHFGRIWALTILRKILDFARVDIETLRVSRDTIRAIVGPDEGYLQSVLSDAMRDAIVAFIQNGGDIRSPVEVQQWLNSPYARYLSEAGSLPDSGSEMVVASSEQRNRRIVETLGSSERPLDVIETVRSLARTYDLYRSAFADRLSARMADIELQLSGQGIWPEELQLTSTHRVTATSAFGAPLAALISREPNLFGRLVVRDITRAADFALERMTFLPWKIRLFAEAIGLMLACREYELRFAMVPRSVDVLCEVGILDRKPIDPMSGFELTISPDGRTIQGPPIQSISKFISLAADSPTLQWRISSILNP